MRTKHLQYAEFVRLTRFANWDFSYKIVKDKNVKFSWHYGYPVEARRVTISLVSTYKDLRIEYRETGILWEENSKPRYMIQSCGYTDSNFSVYELSSLDFIRYGHVNKVMPVKFRAVDYRVIFGDSIFKQLDNLPFIHLITHPVNNHGVRNIEFFGHLIASDEPDFNLNDYQDVFQVISMGKNPDSVYTNKFVVKTDFGNGESVNVVDLRELNGLLTESNIDQLLQLGIDCTMRL